MTEDFINQQHLFGVELPEFLCTEVFFNLAYHPEARNGNRVLATCPDPCQRTLSQRPSIAAQDVSYIIESLKNWVANSFPKEVDASEIVFS